MTFKILSYIFNPAQLQVYGVYVVLQVKMVVGREYVQWHIAGGGKLSLFLQHPYGNSQEENKNGVKKQIVFFLLPYARVLLQQQCKFIFLDINLMLLTFPPFSDVYLSRRK